MTAILMPRAAFRPKCLAPCGRFVRSEDGSAAVEFAIVAVPLIFMVLGMLQVALIFLAGQLLETAVAVSSRLILTGQSMNQSTFATAVCGKIPALFDCRSLMIDVQSYGAFASANTSAPDPNLQLARPSHEHVGIPSGRSW